MKYVIVHDWSDKIQGVVRDSVGMTVNIYEDYDEAVIAFQDEIRLLHGRIKECAAEDVEEYKKIDESIMDDTTILYRDTYAGYDIDGNYCKDSITMIQV